MNPQQKHQLKAAAIVAVGLLLIAWAAGWLESKETLDPVPPQFSIERHIVDDGLNLTIIDCNPNGTSINHFDWEIRNITGHIIEQGSLANHLRNGNWTGVDVNEPLRYEASGALPPEKLIEYLVQIKNFTFIDYDLNGKITPNDVFHFSSQASGTTFVLIHRPTDVVVVATSITG